MAIASNRPASGTTLRTRLVRRFPLEAAAHVAGTLAIGALIIGTWQAGVWNHVFGLYSFTLPRPSDIVRAFHSAFGNLRTNFWVTLKPALIGYAAGNGAGLAAASLLVMTPAAFGRRMNAVLVAFQALPIVGFAPIVALWFGYDMRWKIVVVAILTFPSMFVYANRGMLHLEDGVQMVMDSYEARGYQVFLKVRLPNSLPFVFTALKYTVVLAVIGVVICEIIGTRTGLGYEIEDALQGFSAAEAWAAAALLGILGIVWYALIGIVERVAVPWAAAARQR